MISSGTAGTTLSATARVSNLKAWAVCHSAAGASSRRPASSNSGYSSIKGAAGLLDAIAVTLAAPAAANAATVRPKKAAASSLASHNGR